MKIFYHQQQHLRLKVNPGYCISTTKKPQLKSKSKDIVSAPPPKPQLKSKSKDIVSAPPPTPKPAITESKLSHKDQLTCDKPKLPKKKRRSSLIYFWISIQNMI